MELKSQLSEEAIGKAPGPEIKNYIKLANGTRISLKTIDFQQIINNVKTPVEGSLHFYIKQTLTLSGIFSDINAQPIRIRIKHDKNEQKLVIVCLIIPLLQTQ